MKYSALFSNQRGILHIMPLLLVAAVGILAFTLFSASAPFKNQLLSRLFPKQASEAAGTKLGTFEQILNEYGDAWELKKTPNTTSPFLPVSGGAPGFSEYLVKIEQSPGVWVYKHPDPDNSIRDKFAAYIAKSNAEFLYIDSFEPFWEGLNERTRPLTDKIHQQNSRVKLLGYFVMHEPPPVKAGFNESFYVHQRGKPATPEFRIKLSPDPNDPTKESPIFDITNRDFRNYLIPIVVQAVRDSGLNGIMSDLMYSDALKRKHIIPSDFIPGFPENVVPADVEANWTTSMIQFTEDLKTALGSDLYLIGNVEEDDTTFMENDLLRAGRLDGVIFEDPFNHKDTTGPEVIQKAGGLMNKMKERYPDKKVLFMVTGGQSGDDYPHPEAVERQRQLYFLSAYLMVWNGIRDHSYEYYHPRIVQTQNGPLKLPFNTNAFFKEWDLDLGMPADAQDLGDGLYLRNYTNGKVYWNSSQSDLPIPSPLPQVPAGGFVSVTDGQQLAVGRAVKGKSGDIFITSQAYNDLNAPPSLGSCTNRPPLVKRAVIDGSGGLFVTIAAGTSTASNPPVTSNFIYSINFTGLEGTTTNSRVYVPYAGNGAALPTAQERNFTYQANSEYVTFLVQPRAANAAFTVNLKVTDRCGEYSTFFGRGAIYPAALTAQDAITLRPNFTAATNTYCNNNASRVHLEWYQVPNASGYNIYRNFARIGGTSGLAYNDDTAVQGTAYSYQIKALVNGVEVAGVAKSITAAANCLQLSSPDFGSNTAAKCNGVNPRNYLEWLPVQGASVYKVYRSTAQPGSGVKLADLTTNVFNDDNVTPGVTYNYQIEAAAGSVSKLGTGKSLTTLSSCMPKADLNANTGTYCTALSPTGARVHLEWNAVSGAGYKIFRSTNAPGSGIKLGETSGTAWNDDTAVQGTSYNYQIEAFVGTTTTLGTGKTVVAAANCYTPIPKAPTSTRPDRHTVGDYNGDGKADFSVFRPGSNQWFIWSIATLTYPVSGDFIVPGDYDGNKQTDQAFYRPSTGQWFINGSVNSWGTVGDIPVPGDYNRDGKTDLAVFRPANGYWYVNGVLQTQYGISTDIPVPGDYNGDGITDLAVFRPQNGYWYINGIAQTQWGISTDIPVPGDYDGNGTTDIAVYRPQNGYWYVAGLLSLNWGLANHDIPVPADYNGDGKTDVVVWRPSNGFWYGYNNVLNQSWGITPDKPVAIYPTKTSP